MTSSSKNNHPFNTLSFAVMVNGNGLQHWQAEAVKLLLVEGHTCRLIIVNRSQPAKRSPWQKAFQYLNNNGLWRLYLRFFFKPESKKETPLVALFTEGLPPVIRCTVKRKGFSEYFSGNDVETIRSFKTDFILRFGFNIIRGEILSSARYGIWSFHHDDEKQYRGGPPGFWEIYQNNPVTGAVLQRLTEKLDGGIILKKGLFKTVDHNYAAQIDNLYTASAQWPLQVCRDILLQQADYLNGKAAATIAPVYKAPDNLQTLRFFFKLIFNKMRFHFRELFLPEDWQMALSLEKEPLQPQFKNITWLPKPDRNRYYADPFGFILEDRLHLLFEDYDYQSGRGTISMLIKKKAEFELFPHVIAEAFHLSYPFVIKNEETVYCLPESASQNQVRLYRFDKTKKSFVFEKVLLHDFPAVDPTLLKHNGKWWLFATHRKQSNTALYLFHSDRLTGPFLPHNNNPVKVDITGSRPGGKPFTVNNVMYRPAQDSAETYGKQVNINKITKLTENVFKEEPVTSITALQNWPLNKGLHTVSQVEDYVIFDVKRFRFNRPNFFRKLKQKLSKKKYRA